MTVRTIGVGGGFAITPDFTTLHDWASTVSTLTLSATEVGRLLWTSAGNELSASAFTLTGTTTWNAFPVVLEPGNGSGSPGGGFADNANAATNQLMYSPSAGACLVFSSGGGVNNITTNTTTGNFIVRGLQFRRTSTINGVSFFNMVGSANTIDSCIVEHQGLGGPNGFASLGDGGTIKNNLFVYKGSANQNGSIITQGASRSLNLYNNTFVHLAQSSTHSCSAILRRNTTAGHCNIYNNIFYSTRPSPLTFEVSGLAATSGSVSMANNATVVSSASTTLLTTSANVFNLAATDFGSVTSTGAYDFRISSAAASVVNAGITASTITTVDIIRQTRS